MMGWLRFVFKRVVVVFVRLQEDETMKTDVMRVVREKGKSRVEVLVADGEIEELEGLKQKEPTLLVVSGHGVIRKVFPTDDEEGIVRVTGNEGLVHSRLTDEEGKVVLYFTRRERIIPLEEAIARGEVPVLEISMGSDKERELGETALLLAERFYGMKAGWRELVHGGRYGDRLAGLAAAKIKLAVLCILLGLLMVNYWWNASVRERFAEQQARMSSLEQDVSEREKMSREMERVVREFKGNGTGKYCMALDRIAGIVPSKVNLETLVVNPLLKVVEERKPLVLRDGYIELTGETSEPGDVTVFTGDLAGYDFVRQVQLVSLDKDRESGMFHFKILVGL